MAEHWRAEISGRRLTAEGQLDAVRVPAVLVTGTIGAGKTAVSSEISSQLAAADVAHAQISLDALCQFYPRESNDRFGMRVRLENLRLIWPTFRSVGATRLVMDHTLEEPYELRLLAEAVPGAAR